MTQSGNRMSMSYGGRETRTQVLEADYTHFLTADLGTISIKDKMQ